MDSSIKLGKIFGIPLGINYSWLIMFGLVIFLMSARFEDMYPWWPVTSVWGLAILTTNLFFLSVLIHELSHSLVALAWGIPVKGITLFIFGGVSELEREAQRPLTEFLVSVVGPVTSLALAAIFGFSWYFTVTFSSYLSAVLFTLFAINLSLAIFNMLPGFPLDGGRVLRACIWGATGNYWLATRFSLRCGQGLGILLIAGGVAWALLGNFQAIWISLVGGFLLFVATTNYRQESARELFRSCQVGAALTRHWQIVPGDRPAVSQEVLLAIFLNGYTGILVDGPPYGVVTGRTLTGLSRDPNSSSTLADIMTPLTSFPNLPSTAPVMDALDYMDKEGHQMVALLQGVVPIGLVTKVEILELLQALRRRQRDAKV